ncbi:class I SAM-dependent methyltransferase [Propioniciclava soli]|uniref:Class I SAM-dependent methyltransferase n=1 Tax=Propioniciclava soli TaxID=2775081 RepID=A0ABZ3C8P8_9ACTN
MAKPPIDWAAYLAAFHAHRPGITERVLQRTLSGGHTPYRWLARAVSPRAHRVVDVACGTGAMGRELARPDRTVIGVSLSTDELRLARRKTPGPWLCADARALPLADGSVDAVVSMMGAIVVQPVEEFFAEVGRVLRPGGMFAFMAPTVVPLHPRDLATSLGVVARLRSLPRFPGPTEITGYVPALVGTGLRKVEDARERYHFAVRTAQDAVDVVDALYLPLTTAERRERAVAWLVERTERDEDVRISIAMRRFVALKQGTSPEATPPA